MPTYVIFFSFTQKGVETVTDLPARIERSKQAISKLGGQFVAIYGLLGSQYDTMCFVKAPSDEKVAAIALAISRPGNVRSETHRLFSEDELMQLVALLK